MKGRIAYLDEPPFYWTGPDGSATGAGIEFADVVLRATGATSIEHCRTSSEELLPGVQAGRRDMARLGLHARLTVRSRTPPRCGILAAS